MAIELSGALRRSLWICLVGAACLLCACSDDSSKNSGVSENTEALCSDGMDNDNSGLKDCDDPDCAWFAFCVAANRENTLAKCTDGRDNDKNGLTDCEEDDCTMFVECQKQLVENTPERCADGHDNDRNGDADCADSNCQSLDVCSGIQPENTEELCKDGADNDNNGIADCKDPNCLKLSICQTPEDSQELCSDTIDNDNNGIKDCDEPGCKGFAHCQTSVVIGKCTGEPDSCTGSLRKYCDDDDWKTEYCPLGCDGGKCLTCEDINGPESCESNTHRYCPNPDGALVTESCANGCEGTKCKTCEEANGGIDACIAGTLSHCENGDANVQPITKACQYGCEENACAACLVGQDVCGDDHLTIRHCIRDGAGIATVTEEACNTGLCLNNACVNVEDLNGNHMIDAWEKQAPHVIGNSYRNVCQYQSDCDGEGFCDIFTNDHPRCSVRCIADYECMDGFVCRSDGRCAADAFVTIWETNTANETLTLPQNSDQCFFEIDWGDGRIETISECSQLAHTYANSGRHTIRIKDDKEGRMIYTFGGKSYWWSDEGDYHYYSPGLTKLIEVVSFGKVGLGVTAFYGAENLVRVSSVDIPDSSEMTRDFSYMFSGASKFNPEELKWDVSTVTDMRYMFENASSFNGKIELWDVSYVKNMAHMFDGATSFKSGVKYWNVSKVQDMSYMFHNASSFHEHLNEKLWNVSNVTDMSYMFAGASNFSGNVGTWDVSNVKNMAHMFDGATDFEYYVKNWDVSNVTNMNSMFKNASSYDEGDLNTWNVSHVTDMESMFEGASKFNGEIGNWNVGAVETMKYMFKDASNFNRDISKWNVRNVIFMNGMFMNASKFNGNICPWTFYSGVRANGMFMNAKGFTRDLSSCRWVWDGDHGSPVVSGMFYKSGIRGLPTFSDYKRICSYSDYNQTYAFYSPASTNQGMFAYTEFCNYSCGNTADTRLQEFVEENYKCYSSEQARFESMIPAYANGLCNCDPGSI